MKIERKPIQSLPFSHLFKEYVRESASIKPFFSRFPSDLMNGSVDRRVYVDRQTVHALIKEFNEGLDLSDLSIQNLNSILEDRTYTVVTGQQIGLFGGYLYTIYKTITAIQLAKKLSKEHQIHVVPIFWVADEDHDFEEANHLFVPSSDQVVKISVDRVSELNQQVAREELPESIKEKIEAFFEASGNTAFSEELRHWLEADYQPGQSQKMAFLRFLNRIFGKYGLLFFGSDSTSIKKVASPVFCKAISLVDEIFEALESQSKALEKEFHRQVVVDFSNLFLNDTSGRLKLQFNTANKNWVVKGRTFTQAELIELAENQPEFLSPNVFLRPVLQEFLLPNLAYIAGPGEIAYFAQTQKLFELFGIDMPVIVPRLTATIIEKPFQRYWDELPVSFYDYFQRIEDLESTVMNLLQPICIDEEFTDWEKAVKEVSEPFKNRVTDADGSLEQTVDRAIALFDGELKKIKSKVLKSLKQKESVTLQRIGKVHSSLYPNRTLQERCLSFVHFLNKYGLNCFEQIAELDFSEEAGEHELFFLD